MTTSERQLHFRATQRHGEVPAILLRPQSAFCLYLLGHGAGAGMRHRFLDAIARELAQRGVATLRYQFPYMERGSRRPDPRPVLLETVRSAVEAAGAACPGIPLVVGGKSMGGRMTSLAAAEAPLPGVRGLAFLGFPLHGVGKPPSTERAEHLSHVSVPMLFLQGTRDKLADFELMSGLCVGLGSVAMLKRIEGADHGFHVLKRSGRADDEVIEELAGAVAEWARLLPTSS
jgi:predicted alpha/beta-hydrolase family hydrolase